MIRYSTNSNNKPPFYWYVFPFYMFVRNKVDGKDYSSLEHFFICFVKYKTGIS